MVKSGQVRSGQVRSGQVRSCQVRSGEPGPSCNGGQCKGLDKPNLSSRAPLRTLLDSGVNVLFLVFVRVLGENSIDRVGGRW